MGLLMRLLLTKKQVDLLSPKPKKYSVYDAKLSGFGLMVGPTGSKSFFYAYRFPRGRAGTNRTYTIGRYGDVTVDQAREIAEVLQGDYKRGGDPMARLQDQRRDATAKRNAPKQSVAHIAKEFVDRYAKKRNRSWKETERILNRHVVSAWGKRQIMEITRADVNQLLDKIEDASGAPMATAVLAQVRKMFNWVATRDDKFNSPIVRGMARTSPKKMARDRVLSDDEIRTLWNALEASSAPFKQLVRFLLLTAQRREEVAQTRHSELVGDLWTIPAERYKTNRENAVPISTAAQLVLEELLEETQPATDPSEPSANAEILPHYFVFTTTLDKPFSGFSKCKARLDTEMEIRMREAMSDEQSLLTAEPALKPWRLHDLRRTAKTLMQRGGVRPDISERVLGHVISGVEGTYDRHNYGKEKRAALDVLAREVQRILAGKSDAKVIPLRTRA
jgi:integrase